VSDSSPKPAWPWFRLSLAAAAVLLALGVWILFRDRLTLSNLAAHEARLRELRDTSPLAVAAAAFGLYVLVAACSIPLATVLSLAIGWYFGFWRGLVLVSFASTSGATVSFLVSRYLFRDAVQRRFGERLERFHAALEREGALYLFALRLTPAVPFFVINVVMGLTRLPVRTFWWVSQLGMLPATCIFIYAGASIPDLQTLAEQGASGIVSPQLIVALMALGFFPLVAKRVMGAVRRRWGSGDESTASSGA
jgi:uncharacterized membrane protein YdjX (TVP38/TMEM64 family)